MKKRYLSLFAASLCLILNNCSPDLPKEPPHVHDWDEPTYTWNSEKTTCTAKRICKDNEEHVEKEIAASTYTVITPATETESGLGRYIATFRNSAFTTQTVDVTIEFDYSMFTVNQDEWDNIFDIEQFIMNNAYTLVSYSFHSESELSYCYVNHGVITCDIWSYVDGVNQLCTFTMVYDPEEKEFSFELITKEGGVLANSGRLNIPEGIMALAGEVHPSFIMFMKDFKFENFILTLDQSSNTYYYAGIAATRQDILDMVLAPLSYSKFKVYFLDGKIKYVYSSTGKAASTPEEAMAQSDYVLTATFQ